MKKEIIVLATAFALSLLSFIYDKEIITGISKIRNLALDYVFISIFFASNVFILALFLMTLFLFSRTKRRWFLPVLFALSISSLVSFVLKITVGRLRPFQEGITSAFAILVYFMNGNFNSWNTSFPSFQAVLVFSVLPIISEEFKKFRIIWIVFAFLVAFSRVYFGVHYLSDVLAGGIIGYLIGLFLVYIEKRYQPGKKLADRI